MKLTLAIVLLACAGIAAAQDKVAMRLNWYLVGLHAPLYLGKEKGYYQAEGIDLTINEGRGSVVAAQAVASGTDQFGWSDGGTVVTTAAKGIPIRSVMTIQNVSPFAVVTRADAGIANAGDLVGKRLAITPGDALTQLFPAVLEANSLSRDRIVTAQMDPAAKVVALLERKVDAILGAAGAQDIQIAQKGVPPKVILFWDMGVPTIGMTIQARRDFIEKNPDLVRRLVRATSRAYTDGLADPEAAVAAAARQSKTTDAKVLRDQWLGDMERMRAEDKKARPFGAGDPKVWSRTVELMKRYGGAETSQAASYFFTNEFMPKD